MPLLKLFEFKFKHFKDLVDLHASQGSTIQGLDYKTLPKIGYIAYLGTQPIAAGFLRRLEPSFAQIDTLVSNAYFGSQIRHEALTQVIDNLIDDAKRLKLTGLICHTADPGVLKRANALGFHVCPETIIAKKL